MPWPQYERTTPNPAAAHTLLMTSPTSRNRVPGLQMAMALSRACERRLRCQEARRSCAPLSLGRGKRDSAQGLPAS